MKYFICFIVLGTLLTAQSQNLSDKAQIEQVLNHYIDGFYKGDTSALKKALKPRLYKFGYLKDKETGNYEYYAKMNYNDALAFVQKMKDEGRSRDENEIREVEVLDISNHIATGKVTAVWGVDYMTLSKDNGQWKIEQVIWEGPYEESLTQKPTTYYLIRHAEKDLSDMSNQNPHLTGTGMQRAQNWAKILKNIHFDAIYSTNYHRTLETAEPIAKALNLDITLYSPNDLKLKPFMRETNGQTVLIVGHSNTTPMLSNALIKENKYNQIPETTYGNLYIVNLNKTGANATLLSLE
jgi:broad specificity phosphatase PhoE